MRTTKAKHPAETARRAWESQLLERMRQAAGTTCYARIAALTDVHAESARRYLTRGRPSPYFIARFCKAFRVSPEWLLFGTEKETTRHPWAVIEAKPSAEGQTARPSLQS